jgi:hypothetical protein
LDGTKSPSQVTWEISRFSLSSPLLSLIANKLQELQMQTQTMNRIQSSFEQPLGQKSCQDRLLEERRKSQRLLELSSTFAFQGTLSDFPSDNDNVSPLRSPKKRVKKLKMKKGDIASFNEVESKSKGTKKIKKKEKKSKDAKAVVSKPAITQHKIVAKGKSNRFSRTWSEAAAPAAVQIQRIVRGWYQRLLYRIMCLQKQLDTSDERKRLALQRIEDRLHMHKYTFREKLERKAIASVSETSKGTKQAQEMILYLRKANKKLRERNQKLYNNIQNFKHNNRRLEEANAATAEYFEKLKEHTEHLEVINRKLLESERHYKTTLENVEDGIALREHYYLAEHRVKTCYAQSIATIVDLTDARSAARGKDDFGAILFQLCLVGLEGYRAAPQYPSAPQPPQKDDATAVTADSDSDSDSSSDSESSTE